MARGDEGKGKSLLHRRLRRNRPAPAREKRRSVLLPKYWRRRRGGRREGEKTITSYYGRIPEVKRERKKRGGQFHIHTTCFLLKLQKKNQK